MPTEHLIKKSKLKLGFFFRNRTCFTFAARKKLVAATFLPVLDYGDLLYMHAPAKCLQSLDSVYHSSALRFVTGCKALTHHCTLYSRVEWPSLAARRLSHWQTFIYKAILGILPQYLCSYISKTESTYSLRSNDCYLLHIPKVRTEFGKHSFMHFAPAAWNSLQSTLNLKELISLRTFKNLVTDLESASYRSCSCYIR